MCSPKVYFSKHVQTIDLNTGEILWQATCFDMSSVNDSFLYHPYIMLNGCKESLGYCLYVKESGTN